jgi:uncharacterized membrane protein YqjE
VSGASSALAGSVRRFLSTLTQVASTRLELLVNEIHEERLHLEQMLFYFFAAVVCLGMGVLLLTFFIIVLFWDTHRLLAIAGLGFIFFVTGSVLIMRLQQFSRTKPKLFSASLAELAKDRAQLGGSNE